MKTFESLFIDHMVQVCDHNPDPSHDLLHVQRVVCIAKRLALQEGANLEIVVPASYLHDCIYISKTDSKRNQASRLSADKAIELLRSWGYPERHFNNIYHAISAHSFSAQLVPETIEAKVVQDADRLDAMGAVGIFRCFAFSGLANRPLYSSVDPFCKARTPNDNSNTLDHFFTKLLHLQDKLNTNSAKIEGFKRLDTMNTYLRALEQELLSE
jgi:uncharacterized protein